MATMNGQEDALLELLAAKQWKQAFNLCEKKIKKAPGSDYLLVIRIRILLSWPDPTRLQQALKDLENLLDRKPPVADIEALRALDGIFEAFGVLNRFTAKQMQTWQRAAASRPQDENLHIVWYRSRFNEGDYKGAQQASMSWMKNFPKERKPYFLYILNTHLISERATNEQEKSLMETLAYKYLSKAATTVSESSGGVLSSGRQIQTFEDRYLLLRVYRAQGKYKEAIDMLENHRIGMGSVSGGCRWELAGQYMDLLEKQENWIQLHTVCRHILAESRETSHADPQYDFAELGNDWKTWQMFIQASTKDDSLRDSPETNAVIRAFCDPILRKKERNPRLAHLLFCAIDIFEARKPQGVLLTALIDYFRDFSTKVGCFVDFKPWLSYLDPRGQKKLLLVAAKYVQDLRPQSGAPESSIIFWITSEINLLKLEYHLVISQDCNSHRSDLLAAFVSNCLRVYKESLRFGFELPVSDRRPGDDAALLAAMGLIRLFKMGRRHALLQCIVLLEHTLLGSKHNYDALLILVRLYMFLGAGSLAMDRYNRLSIKNIQHATISWVLYTRLSSIHPYPATYSTGIKGQATIAPLEEMSVAHGWHKYAEDLSRRAVHTMQDRCLWNMSLDTIETNRAVFDGFARCLFHVEMKRIERLCSPSKATVYEKYTIPQRTTDNRDRSAFPDFEGGGLTFEQHLPTVGTSSDPNVSVEWGEPSSYVRTISDLTQDAWLRHQLFLIWLWENLHHGYSELSPSELEAMNTASGWNRASFTSAERGTANIASALSELYLVYVRPDQFEKSAIQAFIVQLFENLQVWLTKSSEALESSTESGTFASITLASDVKIPIWNLYHELFSHIEQCKFILAALEYTITENKKQPYINHQALASQISTLKSWSSELSGNVWASAISVRDQVRDQSFLQRLNECVLDASSEGEHDTMIVQELKDLGNQSEMRKVCQDLRDSWIDGLDGVIRTKFA